MLVSDEGSDSAMRPIRETATLPTVGYVLAGGRSSRMGTDKAALDVNGRSALERQLDLVGRFCGTDIAVVGSVDGHSSAPELADRGGRQGPLDGIITALHHATTSPGPVRTLALVVAVDLWNLSVNDISRLFGVFADPVLGPETDVAYLHGVGEAGEQPLAALWRIEESLAVLSAAFASGERSVVRAWMGLRRTAVVVSESALVNVNTPDDVERWRSQPAPDGPSSR